MSFSWTDTPDVGLSIKNSYMTELKTNIDHIYTQQAHTLWTWVENPPGVGTISTSADWKEVRNALDHIYDNIGCITHNGSYDATHLNVNKSTNNATKHTTYNASQNSSVDSSELSARDAGHLTGYYNGEDEPHYTGNCGSHCLWHCPTIERLVFKLEYYAFNTAEYENHQPYNYYSVWMGNVNLGGSYPPKYDPPYCAAY